MAGRSATAPLNVPLNWNRSTKVPGGVTATSAHGAKINAVVVPVASPANVPVN